MSANSPRSWNQLTKRLEVQGVKIPKGQSVDDFLANHRAVGAAQSERIIKQNRNEMCMQLMRESGVSAKLLTATFDNYQVGNTGQKNALNAARAFAMSFEKNDGQDFIFFGESGTGKNHLGCAIINHITALGFSALIMTLLDIKSKIAETYGDQGNCTELQMIQRFVKPELLIVDEVGLQKGTNHEIQLITSIIDKRKYSNKPTGFLSNIHPNDLTQYLGARAIDRIHEGNPIVVEFNWKSFRRKGHA